MSDLNPVKLVSSMKLTTPLTASEPYAADATPGRDVGGVVQKRALPDPRLSPQDEDLASPGPHDGHEVVERLALAAPATQRGTVVTPCHHFAHTTDAAGAAHRVLLQFTLAG